MAFAKTTRPYAAGASVRPRLHRLLGRQARRPITWIWGPPGAGKTTLVASFLATRRCRSIWYQVDAGDADVATFFYYLAQAAPRTRRPLPLLTPEYRAGLDLFTRRYFRELYRRLKLPFTLVLDNYHEAPDDALLHDVLRWAAEELPRGGRIVVASRSGPPPALARLQVHRTFDVIDWKHLRLTVREAYEVARKLGRRPVSMAEVRRLHALTDGWMAGLLLLLAQRGAEPLSSITGSGPPEVLFDYFAGEIFSKTAPEAKAVLLQTAFLPFATPEMARELTGHPDAAEAIDGLHRASYFTNKRPGAEGAYEYHPLFRAFLLDQAHRTFSPARLSGIRSSAAALLDAAGDVDPAAELLREAGSWTVLAQMICRRAPTLLAQGRVETIDRWLAGIPDAVVASTPWLSCWRGVCHLGRGHEPCCAHCERALAAFRAHGDVDGAFLAWSVIVMSHLMEGWLEPLDSWIALLDELRVELSTRASDHIEARVAATMLVAIAFRQPGHPEGAQWAERALASTSTESDAMLRTLASCGWFLYHWWLGNVARASLVVDEMRALSRRRDVPSVVSLLAAVPVVWHELLHALPSYRQTVVEIREHAQATGLRHAQCATVLTYGTFASLSDGDLDLATAWIRVLASESERLGPTYTFGYHALCVTEAIARDDLDGATVHLDELAARGYSTGYPVEVALAHTLAAYVCCRRGQQGEADAHVRQTLEVGRTIQSPYIEWIARLVEAHVCFAGGRDAEGLPALGAAMALGRAGGYVNSQVWLPKVMARLCARALDAGIEVDYVRNLVRRRRLVCDPPPIETEAWPWPVKIVALGRFGVLKDNGALPSGGKAQRKPLALLKTLVVHGAPDVDERRVMDALWPDADGDAARRALTTAVFRLRRLLGHEAAVVRGNGRIGLNPAHCWVDVWALESLLDRAEATASGSGGATEAAQWTERAAALYEGPLVGGDDDEAPSSSRGDRLRRRLLRQLVAIGRRCEAAGEWQRTADIFEAALKVDPCAEDVYGSLMAAYHRLGRPADVEAVYARCRRALEREMGIVPSRRTDAVLAVLRLT